MAGLSRSAFYKYKDSVYPYHAKGAQRIITPARGARGLAGRAAGDDLCSSCCRGQYPDSQPEYPLFWGGARFGVGRWTA